MCRKGLTRAFQISTRILHITGEGAATLQRLDCDAVRLCRMSSGLRPFDIVDARRTTVARRSRLGGCSASATMENSGATVRTSHRSRCWRSTLRYVGVQPRWIVCGGQACPRRIGHRRRWDDNHVVVVVERRRRSGDGCGVETEHVVFDGPRYLYVDLLDRLSTERVQLAVGSSQPFFPCV